MEREVIDTFERYADAFATLEPEAISEFWIVPSTISVNDQIAVLATEKEFRSNAEVLCTFYEKQRVKHVHAQVLDCKLLLPNAAQVSVRYVLMGREMSSICEWTSHYILRRTQENWKIGFAIADEEIRAWAARGTPLG